MSEIHLLFVPGASPTYIPLGIASLYSYLKKNGDNLNISAKDLSISFWNYLSDTDTEFAFTKSWFKGELGNFFSTDLYQRYLEELGKLYHELKVIENGLTMWLEKGEENFQIKAYRNWLKNEMKIEEDSTIALSALYPGQVIHLAVISKLIREEYKNIKIIAGGAVLAALNIDELADALPEIDIFHRGEGEEALGDILNGIPLAEISGCVFRQDNGVISNGRPKAIDYSKLGKPDFSFTNMEKYFNPQPVLPVLFSRGCRWRKCKFCSHNFSFAGYRSGNYKEFAEMLKELYLEWNCRHFYFADQYISAEDLEGISQAIIEKGINIRWHVMGRPTADYTKERLRLLYKAGCRWISWGVESGSQELLNICNKGTNIKDLEKVLVDTSVVGISNLAMMIFGMPGSNQNHFDETLAFADRVSAYIDAFTSSSFQLFEGTPFFANREALGLSIQENEVLLKVGEKEIHSCRWTYLVGKEVLETPPGFQEVELWDKWKFWARGGSTLFEKMICEHYLLFADAKAEGGLDKPNSPFNRPGNRPNSDSGKFYDIKRAV